MLRFLRPIVVAALVTGLMPARAAALGDPSFVTDTPVPGAAQLVAAGRAAPILVDADDHAGVRRAAGDLRHDIERVTGIRPELLTDRPSSTRGAVIVGTLGKSRLIDRLTRAGRLDVSAIRGRWEASIVQVVRRPLPGVERAVVVAGSDKRGTIYGIYDISEQIGVSPWYWWAEVPVRPRSELFVRPGRYVRGEPAVKYRGIFINDEQPALGGWVREKFGGFNSRFYTHVFELILRMRGNFLWPAMWGQAFAADDPLSPKLADEYGVVIGTSHHEPMMRAHDEWRRYGKGPWNYGSNAEALREFWREGVRRSASYENIITLGMRGDGDEPMSREANVALLERIVSHQREIIAEALNADVARVPQVWALYKEVQEYYEKGMRVPDDVTLLWADDNWGNIRRLPTPEERGRSGGAGVYYHFDYVGGPRSYKWLNTVPLAKIWEQMHLAWRYGATRIWIVNVGDIKPMEYPTQFFLDYAWDPSRWPAERLGEYARLWAAREIGPEHADAIAAIVTEYTRFNGRRKPEMLEPRTYSLVNYREAETVAAEYRELARRADEIYERLPPAARDAYYQLVLYPVKASAVVNELYVTVGLNRLYAVQGRTSTNALAERARELFREDERLTREYHALGGGRWNHMMDQTRIGYTYWQQPIRNAMPGVQDVQPSASGALAVAVEGSEGSWPGDLGGQPTLPALTVFDDRGPGGSVEVFNRGREPVDFAITTSDPWLRVDVAGGTLGDDRRIHVSADWSAVPPGTDAGTITVTGTGDTGVVVKVPLVNPAPAAAETLAGFVETNGYVSIEAEHFTRAVAPQGREWQVIPHHGRTLSGVTVFPVTAVSDLVRPDMRLEYEIYLFHDGPLTVEAHLAPTQKFRPGEGLRYAVSFDDEPPQVANMHADGSLQAWERSVADGATVIRTKHTVRRGARVLKFWSIDPGVVLQKLVVDTGTMRPSYLGPPESPRVERGGSSR